MVANSGILSSLSTSVSTQLVDKTDSPHSGLFKGLHSMAQGNYALKDGSTLGFAHTFTTSSGNIQVALTAGKGFSNGQYIAVDALSATTINKPSSGALYHWVAFADDGDGTGTISIVAGTSDGVVPDLTVTLTPISLIKVQSTDTHSTVAFQTFTTSKTENTLSIGYTNSNAYTETGSITSAAGGTTITNSVGDLIIDNTDVNDQIIMQLGTDTAATAVQIKNNNGDILWSLTGAGAETNNGLFYLTERASAGGDGAGFGQLWVKNDAPNNLYFTDDAGNDIALTSAGAITGAALTGSTNNTIATVTGANALTGEANLTFDGSTLAVTGALQINNSGGDGDDGIMIVSSDTTTSAGNLLGGIGFDSVDGNVPSSITEASAYIAAYAAENHATTDKGGELKMGISFIDDDDDTTSIVLSRIGYPTSTNATVYAGAFSRAAVATVAAATYSPAIADSGTVIIMTNASSIVTLPDVGATEIGVQFTIINNSGGGLSGKIVSADTSNTRFNGAGSYAAQDIADDAAKTYLCVAADNWQVIG